jgi:penicillin-binding protein 1A
VRVGSDSSGSSIMEAFRPGTENSARPPGGGGGATAAGLEQGLGGLY